MDDWRGERAKDRRSKLEKLVAMATQDTSPAERDAAIAKLKAQGNWPPPPPRAPIEPPPPAQHYARPFGDAVTTEPGAVHMGFDAAAPDGEETVISVFDPITGTWRQLGKLKGRATFIVDSPFVRSHE